MWEVKSFLGIWSLKTGALFSGIGSIVLAILTIVALFTINAHWNMIIIPLSKFAVQIIFTIFLCMTIFYSALMVVGAIKRKTLYMLPWVTLTMVAIPGILISVLYTSIMFFIQKSILEGVLCLIIGLIFNVFCAYAWLVTNSYYRRLKLEKMSTKIGPYGKPYTYQRP
ncbi:uncharacterized protein LOC117170109 [Belonocnema kinseyi]|uniref:uncharacterized protein LOC117170109 n=1 Tax=Belonocnema kinseyi TaxID=2817044 RepID=UPI00143D617E|nr:uncharacterized protein LOC117170109 [Belonocnema kinseyi]XP_033212532.1 uncharacterized protein LOC117170109 [Belonocnema kinseyi]